MTPRKLVVYIIRNVPSREFAETSIRSRRLAFISFAFEGTLPHCTVLKAAAISSWISSGIVPKLRNDEAIHTTCLKRPDSAIKV